MLVENIFFTSHIVDLEYICIVYLLKKSLYAFFNQSLFFEIHITYEKLPKYFHFTADNVRDDYSQVLARMGNEYEWKTL